jgi:hypothetical protein
MLIKALGVKPSNELAGIVRKYSGLINPPITAPIFALNSYEDRIDWHMSAARFFN